MQELEDRQTQDVAIDRRHPLEPPVVGLSADQLVDLGEVLESALDELACMLEGTLDRRCLSGRRRCVFGWQKAREDLPHSASTEVLLVQHLDRHLSCSTPLAHRNDTSLRGTPVSVDCRFASQRPTRRPGSRGDLSIPGRYRRRQGEDASPFTSRLCRPASYPVFSRLSRTSRRCHDTT